MLDVSKLSGAGTEIILIVTLPGQPEKRYPVRAAAMRVGRTDQSDICIPEASVSSRHCEFVKDGQRLLVRDLGSSNGTFLREQRITESDLQDGDVLRLGKSATVRVQMQAGGGRAAPPPQDHNPNATAMMSLDQLGHAPPPPPPPRRQPSQPQALHVPPVAAAPAPQPADKKKKMILYGGIAGGVLLLAIVVVVVVNARARAEAERLEKETLELVEKELGAILADVPCTSVQDGVLTLTQLDKTEGLAPPALPANPKLKPQYGRFVEVQRDKAKQCNRIAKRLEEDLAKRQVAFDRLKGDLAKLPDEKFRAAKGDLATGLDERLVLTQDFIGGWKRLDNETQRYADVTEAVFVNENGDQNAFAEFRISKPAPLLLGTCKKAHEASGKDLELKLAALKDAAKAK
jgi:hypothetical protein